MKCDLGIVPPISPESSSEENPARAAHSRYRPDVDGLRGLAVLPVVLFHYFPALAPGGFVGVDVFFVISGFLITTIVINQMESRSFSLRAFYAARVRRLFPSLLLMCGAALVFGRLVLFPDEFARLGKHVLAGLAFASNVAVWRESGYFDPGSESRPLQHLWSLAVEEQFYLVWPLLIAFFWKRGRIVSLVLATIALSLAGAMALQRMDESAAFLLPFGRLWEIGLGALLAISRSDTFPRNRLTAWLQRSDLAHLRSFFGPVLILTSALALNAQSPFPSWRALGPTLGAVLIISAGPSAWFNRVLLSARPVIWLGLISFPLYLWHWPILVFARMLDKDVPATTRGLLLLVALVLASLTYQFVERPIRFGGWRRSAAPVLVVVAILVGSVGLACYMTSGFPSAAVQILAADVMPDRWGADTRPQFPCPQRPTEFGSGPDWCRLSSPDKPSMALWGDSHAQHLFPGLANEDSRTWMLMSRGLCPPLSGVEVEVRTGGCKARNESVLRSLREIATIRTVVLSFISFYPSGTLPIQGRLGDVETEARISTNRLDAPAKEELFFLGLDESVRALESSGKRVVLFMDIPRLPSRARSCLRPLLTSLASEDDCSQPRQRFADLQGTYRAIAARLRAGHPGLMTFDPIDLMCPGDRCIYRTYDMTLYRDSNHFSIRGSRWMARHFLDWLKQQEAEPPSGASSQSTKSDQGTKGSGSALPLWHKPQVTTLSLARGPK